MKDFDSGPRGKESLSRWFIALRQPAQGSVVQEDFGRTSPLLTPPHCTSADKCEAVNWEHPMTSNIEAIKRSYEFFKRKDIPALLGDLIADNCTWISPGPKDKLPWAGTFKGKQEIANFFAQVERTLELTEFTPREMIEQGDTVVVLGTLAGRAKTTDKPVKNEWAHVFKFSQGKVVFFQEYIDTAADVMAMS